MVIASGRGWSRQVAIRPTLYLSGGSCPATTPQPTALCSLVPHLWGGARNHSAPQADASTTWRCRCVVNCTGWEIILQPKDERTRIRRHSRNKAYLALIALGGVYSNKDEAKVYAHRDHRSQDLFHQPQEIQHPLQPA